MSRAIQHQHPQQQQQPLSPQPLLNTSSHRFLQPHPNHLNQYQQALPLTPTSPLDFTDRIPFNELQFSNETLGSGSFGTVFKGKWNNRHVAIKQFKTREQIDSFSVEAKQLSCVKHPNIVTLYGASRLADSAYLIMEYAEGGSLNHLLHECKQQKYDLRHACSWARQTAKGVAYLHGIRPKPIMHRDLKPLNLLLFSRGKILKICDFGTACTVKTQMTNNTGSASYMAPEVFATSSYLESGDVFSWSIIFWEILARQHPYSQQYSNPYQILWRVQQEGARPNELESCPKIIWKLITKSWNKDPQLRPSMREVAEEMDFIYSLTEKQISLPSSMVVNNNINSSDNNNTKPKSPNRQLFPTSPLSPHYVNQYHNNNNHHQQQQQVVSFIRSNLESPNSAIQSPQSPQSSADTQVKRGLYNHSKALKHRLELLMMRAKMLEESVSGGRSANLDLFEEFAELKKEVKTKKDELKQRQQLAGTFERSLVNQSTNDNDNRDNI